MHHNQPGPLPLIGAALALMEPYVVPSAEPGHTVWRVEGKQEESKSKNVGYT